MIRLLAPLALVLVLAATPLTQTAEAQTAYPNPLASGPLTVQADAPGAAFELYDLLGRTLDPRADLAPGVYLWRLRYADGSASDAQRITRLARGPLDVHLATDAAPLASAATGRTAPEAAASGCAPAPGGVLFAGAYHRPAPGTTLSRGATMRVQNPSGAAFQTCLPGVRGASYGFPAGSPAWSTASGILGTTFGGDVGGEPLSASFLIEPDALARGGEGTSASLSGGVDPAKERTVEVIRYDASGAPVVVSSATIPAGTPLSTPFGRVSSGYLVITMERVTAAGWTLGSDGGVREDVAVAQFDFRTEAPTDLTFQLPGQSPVQGDAISITAQIDGVLALDLFSMDAGTTEFEVETLGFGTWSEGKETGRPAPEARAAAASGVPVWLRTQDPDGLFATGPNTGVAQIQCGQGETCARYGAEVSPGFITFGAETTVRPAPEALVSFPTAQSFRAGPFSAASGRGLLLERLDEFETDAYYTITLENKAATTAPERRAVVTFAKPRADRTSIQVDDLPASGAASGDTPAFTRYELRYVQDGRVRVQKTLPTGRRVVFRAADLEIIDAFATFGAEGTVKTGSAAGGPVFRYDVEFRGGDEYVEVIPVMDASASGSVYQRITWTYTAPWTLGFTTFGAEGSVRPAPEPSAALADEGWAFEIE